MKIRYVAVFAAMLLAPAPAQSTGLDDLVGRSLSLEVVALDGGTLLIIGPLPGPDVPDFLTLLPYPLEAGRTRIGLWGINAPNHDAPGGWAATAALDDILGSRPGEVDGNAEVTCRVKSVDRQKRLIADCVGGDSLRSLSTAMVARGWAIPYRAFTWADPADRNAAEFLDRAMAVARDARQGLWALPGM